MNATISSGSSKYSNYLEPYATTTIDPTAALPHTFIMSLENLGAGPCPYRGDDKILGWRITLPAGE